MELDLAANRCDECGGSFDDLDQRPQIITMMDPETGTDQRRVHLRPCAEDMANAGWLVAR